MFSVQAEGVQLRLHSAEVSWNVNAHQAHLRWQPILSASLSSQRAGTCLHPDRCTCPADPHSGSAHAFRQQKRIFLSLNSWLRSDLLCGCHRSFRARRALNTRPICGGRVRATDFLASSLFSEIFAWPSRVSDVNTRPLRCLKRFHGMDCGPGIRVLLYELSRLPKSRGGCPMAALQFYPVPL